MTDAPPPTEPAEDTPEQMRVRRGKRAAMLAAGVDPYPVTVPRTHTLGQLRKRFDPDVLGPDANTAEVVSVAGRVIFVRNTGKLCFARLRAGEGTEMQVMVSLDAVGQHSLDDFKALVDIGDHLSVTGEVVTSRRGELSVRAESWVLAAKALRPLPVEHKPLSDEARVRMRYVDLIVRPEAADMVRMRAAVLATIRRVLSARGFVEVETPILQYVHGGAAARPFHTHFNVFDQDMTLRIALEPHLKRAVVGGLEKVYEIGRNFRNEGIDSTHHPEFTMLEAYEAYGDYDTMADLTAELIRSAARAVGRTVVTDGGGGTIDLEAEWHEITIEQAVSGAVGEPVTATTPVENLRVIAAQRGIATQPQWGSGEVLVELFEQLVERTLLTPTFVKDFPLPTRPLARRHRSRAGLTEAWDLVIAGVEIATAYSELSDPVDQRSRFEAQKRLAEAGDPEATGLDEDFLRALEYGMPPTGGLGMGVDRVLRMLTGVGIRETILFPLVRPD
ncbi:MAG: lysine--tRNA ligase [Nocardioidaceae bacterium]